MRKDFQIVLSVAENGYEIQIQRVPESGMYRVVIYLDTNRNGDIPMRSTLLNHFQTQGGALKAALESLEDKNRTGMEIPLD